jgi:mono/diheme cytochrome c family protein
MIFQGKGDSVESELGEFVPSPGLGGRMSLAVRGGILALAAAIAMALSTPAFPQDEAQVIAGLDAWKKAACANCHGAFANGVRQVEKMPNGANLRETMLDRAGLVEITRCGIPGAEMPAHDAGAFTENECYGILGEMPEGVAQAKPLSLEEIEALVDYLMARVVGGGPITREECELYYPNPAKCRSYRPAE